MTPLSAAFAMQCAMHVGRKVISSGDSVTVISEATRGKIWPTQPAPPLHPTDVKLQTYTGEAIPVVGKLTVQYQGQEEELPLVVAAGDGPSLLGRDWLAMLKLDWKHIFNVQTQESLQDQVSGIRYHI